MDKDITEKLKQPPENLSTRSQSGRELTYVQGWWVIDQLNEIFGTKGWSYNVLDGPTRLSAEWHEVDKKNYDTQQWEKKQRFDVVCEAKVALIITLDMGGSTREDVGYGSGMTYKIGQEIDAYEGAGKEAVTDALKRAARTLGNRLGNCLYDKKFLANLKKPPTKKPPAAGKTPVYANTGQRPEMGLPPTPSEMFNTPEYKALRAEYSAKLPKSSTEEFIKWCENIVQADLKKQTDWSLQKIEACRQKLGAIK